MFDEMPPGKRRREDGGSPAEVGRDPFSTLPEALMYHVLSFLPSEEAVRMSLLARRWRYLWKSATVLRVGRFDKAKPAPVKAHRKFVDHLLLLRGGSPLDTCEFRFGQFQDDEIPQMNLWVRHAMMCKLRVLRLHIIFKHLLELDDLPLVSQHLTRLDLHGVVVHSNFLNFLSCPALEYLKLFDCGLMTANKVLSKSLKHLILIDCTFDTISRIRIYTPSLVSLSLDGFWERTPILDSMPSLVKAFVRITEESADVCTKPDYEDCDCQCCCGGSSVLLKGLSQVKNLVLISRPDKIIFRSDLRWCPMFGNLKILLLNDYWCAPDEFNALVCILEHSPILEKLTLELFTEGPSYKVEMKGSFNLMERSAKISEQLNIVEVKCQDVDERVLKVLKFLCTLNIHFIF